MLTHSGIIFQMPSLCLFTVEFYGEKANLHSTNNRDDCDYYKSKEDPRVIQAIDGG